MKDFILIVVPSLVFGALLVGGLMIVGPYMDPKEQLTGVWFLPLFFSAVAPALGLFFALKRYVR